MSSQPVSKLSQPAPAVARSTVVDVLWSLVLPWDGEYEDGRLEGF